MMGVMLSESCRLVRQMLEAKQKSEADAEEERRKAQQSALAKYRQAFASDAEVTFTHKISCTRYHVKSSL